mgnify:CR=1 FL=1
MRKVLDLNKYQVVSVGTTGSARKLIGTMLGASVIKNEITAHAFGTIRLYPDVRTIFEIGGQDSKITLVNDGIVTDYAMNTLCAAGTGAFISALAKRLDVPIEEVATYAFNSKIGRPVSLVFIGIILVFVLVLFLSVSIASQIRFVIQLQV